MLINFAILLTMLIGLCALALDGGMLQWKKVQLQNAADAAALSAAYEMAHNLTDYQATAVAEATQNGFTSSQNGVVVTATSPPVSGVYAKNAAAVQVVISQSNPSIFRTGSNTVTASATASIAPCVYVMDTSPGSGQYDMYFNNTTYEMNCAVYGGYNVAEYSTTGWVNAISFTGASSASVLGGGALKPGHSTIPPFYWSTPALSDPLSWMPTPANYPTTSQCDYNNATFNGTGQGPVPGAVYCGGLTVNGGSVNFPAGVYIVVGGLNFQGATKITGTGVSFYLTKTVGGTFTGFQLGTSSSCPSVTLTAPTVAVVNQATPKGLVYSMPAGVLVFGDRGWSGTGNEYDVLFGGSQTNFSLDGIIYMTNTGLKFTGGTYTSPNYFGVVVQDFYEANSNVTINGNYSGVSGGSPYRPGVGLAE